MSRVIRFLQRLRAAFLPSPPTPSAGEGFFGGRNGEHSGLEAPSPSSVEKGLFVFGNTGEVIAAERLLREHGFGVSVMGPPPALRTGCDMVVVFPLMQGLACSSLLARHGLPPLQMLPVDDPLLAPVSLFHAKDCGDFLMLRAANMKITLHRPERRIVNVSGGGCPDVPYLAARLTGKLLEEAEEPALIGRTLCGYALHLAYAELREIIRKEGSITAVSEELSADLSAKSASALLPVGPRADQASQDRLSAHAARQIRPLKDKDSADLPLGREYGEFLAKQGFTPRASLERPWLVVGTIPEADFPLTLAPCREEASGLLLGNRPIPAKRGTPALLGAAALASALLGLPPPVALLCGDTGNGAGSRTVYADLCMRLSGGLSPCGITFHYLLPDIDSHNRILSVLEGVPRNLRPLLVADAGHMYAAKMSGYAGEYDLFTPDVGELAFLADEQAPHPFYTRGFLLADEDDAEALIVRAASSGNVARHMLVKGSTDRVVRGKEILCRVNAPDVPELEPIGGTGDTVAGMATALLAAGIDPAAASRFAAICNREAGAMAKPSPACSISDLLPFVAKALAEVLHRELRGKTGVIL